MWSLNDPTIPCTEISCMTVEPLSSLLTLTLLNSIHDTHFSERFKRHPIYTTTLSFLFSFSLIFLPDFKAIPWIFGIVSSFYFLNIFSSVPIIDLYLSIIQEEVAGFEGKS